MQSVHTTLAILVLAALFTGCTSQKAKQSVDRENSRLRWIVKLYVHASQQGRANNESDFKQFIAGLAPDVRDKTLGSAGVQRLDELFVSERDGKPFVIFYGAAPKGVASGVVAFEQAGVGGQRYVGYALGMIEDVDESRFDELVPAAARNQK